jgi:hypothetical protein
MTEEDIYNFLINGHIKGNIDFLKELNVDHYTFVDCNYDDYQKPNDDLISILNKVYIYIDKNYLSKVFVDYKLLNMNAWSGVDSKSSDWHNDLQQGFNSNIIVYLDDSLNKNSIEIRNAEEEFKIYPLKGDFVWLNQKTIFQHKATHITGNRRVLSFELEIPSLR